MSGTLSKSLGVGLSLDKGAPCFTASTWLGPLMVRTGRLGVWGQRLVSPLLFYLLPSPSLTQDSTPCLVSHFKLWVSLVLCLSLPSDTVYSLRALLSVMLSSCFQDTPTPTHHNTTHRSCKKAEMGAGRHRDTAVLEGKGKAAIEKMGCKICLLQKPLYLHFEVHMGKCRG